jgi:hypothetical protein
VSARSASGTHWRTRARRRARRTGGPACARRAAARGSPGAGRPEDVLALQAPPRLLELVQPAGVGVDGEERGVERADGAARRAGRAHPGLEQRAQGADLRGAEAAAARTGRRRRGSALGSGASPRRCRKECRPGTGDHLPREVSVACDPVRHGPYGLASRQPELLAAAEALQEAVVGLLDSLSRTPGRCRGSRGAGPGAPAGRGGTSRPAPASRSRNDHSMSALR